MARPLWVYDAQFVRAARSGCATRMQLNLGAAAIQQRTSWVHLVPFLLRPRWASQLDAEGSDGCDVPRDHQTNSRTNADLSNGAARTNPREPIPGTVTPGRSPRDGHPGTDSGANQSPGRSPRDGHPGTD